jgi:hypothetical protein
MLCLRRGAEGERLREALGAHGRDGVRYWMLIWNRRHLENVVAAQVRHYSTGRPHRGVDLNMPATGADELG